MKVQCSYLLQNKSRTIEAGITLLRAESCWTRVLGLLKHTSLPDGFGMLLTPSSGVHTFGMRFPIDIVALDRKMKVIGCWSDVGPGKIRAVGLRTHSVLELGSGQAAAFQIALGDQLEVTAALTEATGLW